MVDDYQSLSLTGNARLVLDCKEYFTSYSLHYRVDQVYDFFILLTDLPESLVFSLASDGKPIKVTLDRRPETTFQIKKVKDNQLWCRPINGHIGDVSDETVEIAEVRASLVNFRFVRSNALEDNYSLKDELGVYHLGSTHFVIHGVEVKIICTRDTDRAHKQLRQDGGFAVTHLLTLKPTNKKTVSPDELNSVLIMLHKILACANGAWVGIHHIKGFNSLGNLSYFPITSYLCTRHQGRFGWFDANHGNVMGLFAPQLSELLNDNETADIFDRALYWYVRANNSEGTGIDTGIILATTGLELLAEYSIKKFDIDVRSSIAGRKPHLGDKIRAATLYLRIPVNIDERTSPQSFHSRDINNWEDIPAVIVKYRNDLVHPTSKIKSDAMHTLTIEVWQLSVWYLELFILRMMGYNGLYSNRLKAKWVGEVEPVPWA